MGALQPVFFEGTQQSAGFKDEKALILRFQAGDTTAFNPLWEKYEGRIRNLVWKYAPGPDDVDDLMQEVAIKAYNGLGNFRRKSGFYTWLYRIATNVCLNECEKRDVRPEGHAVDHPVLEDDSEWLEFLLADHGFTSDFGEGDPGLDELRKVVNYVIGRMSEDMRENYLLYIRDLYAYRKIAEKKGRSLESVNNMLFRAREKMRQVLDQYLNGDGQMPDDFPSAVCEPYF